MPQVSHVRTPGHISVVPDLPQAVVPSSGCTLTDTASSPIQRMPVEIIQKIFLSCLPRDEYTRPDPRSAPLLLNQICSWWRSIASSTPRLWCSLWIQLSRSNVGRRLNIMTTWLYRSAACALSLHTQVQSTGLEIVPLFFALLDAHRLRWKDLRLVLPFGWARVAIHVLNRPTPLLEVLRLRVAKSQDNSLSTPGVSFVLTDISAPRLRNLCWGITGPHRVLFLPQLSRLQDIDVDYEISVAECLDILQQCSGLISCEFWRIRIIQSDAPVDLNSRRQVITHPRLRSLSLHSTVVTDPLLEYLTLPALIKLKIAVTGDASNQIPSTWSQARFNSFFARSASPLQYLILQDVLPSEEALIQCLERVSASLTELVLLDTSGLFVIRDRILTLLTQDFGGHTTCLCPRLEALRFGRSLLSTDGLLANMVESRWRRTWPDSVTRLRSINPCISAADHPNDVRRLTALRDEGLHWP